MVNDLGLFSLKINCDTPGKTSIEKWKSNTGLFPVSCFQENQIYREAKTVRRDLSCGLFTDEFPSELFT
jgi:hypothetical protein